MAIKDIIVNGDGTITEVEVSPAEEAARAALWASRAIVRPAQVDRECDRRTQTMFVFAGVAYQLTERALTRITALGADARFAVLAGAVPGDLRWADPDSDFGWIATDNTVTPMDAQTMAAFADAAKVWVSRNTFAARALKDMTPIPADFAADGHWPD